MPNFEVQFLGPKTREQIASELEDIRKVNELRHQIRQEEIESDRQRELKRQKDRAEAASKAQTKAISISVVPPTPPNSPASPDSSDSLYGSPKIPSHILELHKMATTQQERDEAELAAAIWLSLNPEAVEGTPK